MGPGGNHWEVEWYDPEAYREASVYAPRWKGPMSGHRFRGKGYIPQGLTHGTLQCNAKSATDGFLRDVFGLEIVPGERPVVYFKHSSTPWYVVVAPMKKRRYFNANSRYTLALESPTAVEEAHRSFVERGKTLRIHQLGELQSNHAKVSFLLSDPDKNWWEIAASTP